MQSRFACVGVIFLLAHFALACEWKFHNRMSFNARQVLLIKVAADPELRAFLQERDNNGFGEDLDTRAGNPCDPKKILTCPWTDEDLTEGRLNWLCGYTETGCGVRCTVDHFHPPLLDPVAGKDAYVHSREYFDLAIKLYKAAKCGRDNANEHMYLKWSAQALSHAIHLVEDMGSPQNTPTTGTRHHACAPSRKC